MKFRFLVGLVVWATIGAPALAANFQLPNDQVVSVPIHTVNQFGIQLPIPNGDGFVAMSSLPASLNASVGSDSMGNPVLILTPLVQHSLGITVTLHDTAGLATVAFGVDIVADVPTMIVLTPTQVIRGNQPIPTAPGP